MPELPDLGEKVGPLPLWGWVVVGAGGVLLIVWLSGRRAPSATADAGSMGYAAPTGDQMTGNALNDLKNSLNASMEADRAADAAQDEAFAAALAGTQQQLLDTMSSNAAALAQMMGANQDAMASLVGQQAEQAKSYQGQLAATNQAFFDQMLALMQSFKGNGTAPVTNGTPGPTVTGWLAERLQSPYWLGRKYVRRDDSTLGSEYGAAVDAFIRSDNPTGLNTAGNPSAVAQQQLASLIAQGQVALNPYWKG